MLRIPGVPTYETGCFHMPDYRRNYVPGGTYCVTAARRHILTERNARLMLRTAIEDVQAESPFNQVAFVLLPDHFHTIWTLPPDDDRYSTRIMQIKENFTRAYLAAGGTEVYRPAWKIKKGERGVWQSRFWEHTVSDDDDFKRCLDYIHWNPVKHGYVTRPCDYPWSTFKKFVRIGEYTPDWGTGLVPKDVLGAEWE